VKQAVFLAAALAIATSGRTASAAQNKCGDPDLLDSFPAVSDPPAPVPTNAVLSAHYAPTAQYLGEDVKLQHLPDDPIVVTASFDESEGMLRVSPPEPLVAGDTYQIVWPRLAGIGTASRGNGATVKFTVANGADETAPDFVGLDHIHWDVRRERDQCTDSLEDRFAFDLFPGHAEDDFGTQSLALVVYQTRGPNISSTDPPFPVTTVPLPPEGDSVRILRTIDDAAGRACFAALVRDLQGHASGGAEHEVCVHTTRPPFFYGCHAASPAAPPKAGLSAAFGALLLALAVRLWHRRPS